MKVKISKPSEEVYRTTFESKVYVRSSKAYRNKNGVGIFVITKRQKGLKG